MTAWRCESCGFMSDSAQHQIRCLGILRDGVSLDERARLMDEASRAAWRRDLLTAVRGMFSRPELHLGSRGCGRCGGFVVADFDGLVCLNCAARQYRRRTAVGLAAGTA